MSPILAEGENPLGFLSQFGVEWQMLVSQGVSFAIVAAALYFAVFKPVMKAADERKRRIEQGLQDAQKAKEELANAKAEADKQTAEAAAQAAQILKEARDDAKRAQETAAREASAKAEEIRERANEQIERDKIKMREDLRGELSALVAEAAEAVVGEVLSDAQRGELARRAAGKLGK